MNEPTRLTRPGLAALRSGILVAATMVLTLPAATATQGQQLEYIAADPSGGTDAAISPDGRYIVASTHKDASWDLRLFDRQKRLWSPLTSGESDDTEPQWSPDGKSIAFTSVTGDDQKIWVVDVATAAKRQLTDTGEAEEYSAWSPDGQSIVYTGGPWKARNFFVVPAQGGTPQSVLPTPGHVGACSFHPNGESLVCHTYDSGFGDLLHLSLDGRIIRQLTEGEDWDYKPNVSPDGQWLAFSRSSDDQSSVRFLSLADDPPVLREETLQNGRWPMFTADGTKIFFHRIVERGGEVRLLDRATGRVQIIAGAEDQPQQATFDPTGLRIAYCGETEGRFAIWIYDRRSEHRSKVPTGGWEACFPSWSSDGRRLGFVARRGERWEIATANTDGSNLTIWTAGKPGLRDLNAPLTWSPDSQRIAFTSTTAPYESDVFVLDTRDGSITNVTQDVWYDEAPSWTPDGAELVFMSTRGGGWTWGLFGLSFATGDLRQIAEPDYVEKSSPRLYQDGWGLWMQVDKCLGASYIVERTPIGDIRLLWDHPGARWPSRSPDGSAYLFTIVNRTVQYWLATWSAVKSQI